MMNKEADTTAEPESEAAVAETIKAAVAAANGRARARTITTADVCAVLRRTLAHGWGTTGRQDVGPSYGHAAYTSVADAVLDDRRGEVVLAATRDYCRRASPFRMTSWAKNWRPETIERERQKVIAAARKDKRWIRIPVVDVARMLAADGEGTT